MLKPILPVSQTVLPVAELLEFCNQLRRAGGAEELEALKPGIRKQSKHCLIAVNVNFECAVDYRFTSHPTGVVGHISSNDPRLVPAAVALGLEALSPSAWSNYKYRYRLPVEVTNSAIAFDRGDYPDLQQPV